MDGFIFNTTPSIVCKYGVSQHLGAVLNHRLGNRILVVSDKSLTRLGLIAPIIESLINCGVEVSVFDDVIADPPESNIMSGIHAATTFGATGIVGIGGGSPMDVAKLIALLVGSKQTLKQVYGVGQATGPRLPLALVPTTAGTGSEVTPISIVTTGEAAKMGVVSPWLLPDVAVLDGALTLGLPSAVTASTGIDAMVHAVEAYASMSQANNPISRGLARQALQLLSANIREATRNGSNASAREAMLLGSMLAGQAFANSPVAAVHALAYPIGARFHVSHGLSNALVLPHVLTFNLERATRSYADIAADVFPFLAEQDEGSRARSFVRELAALTSELGLPTRLRDVGIPEDSLPMLASDAMKQTRLLVNNPREVTEQDALAIYQSAF
ncbi:MULTISPECIES: iron-containing alcohol dehydrogenase [Caballeronia]|uniref:iron-containing alcohol dehydrogenase n=1 Tax=Caballeronia TaxID=1827195 RepID=UPI001FCFCB57|nr:MULTISPECIES: iron-containing alcohol dehydrogenase [Caballeronia]MDR5799118.1 iron-containing alcohol dehydrogenase [Caballeronia sp. LZ001]